MKRQLTITTAEWASRGEEGRLWLVREGVRWGTEHLEANAPPVEFVQACALCENEDITCHCGCGGPCNACCIELEITDGFAFPVVVGHAYAVGEPLPIYDLGDQGHIWPALVILGIHRIIYAESATSESWLADGDLLAHAGPVEWLVGKWAIRLEVVPS